MAKLKHSKFKNTGILFELLVRQIASDTLSDKKCYATEIIKKHFRKGSQIARELELYQALTKENFDSEYKAQEFVNIILKERAKLNESTLKREKYNLIKSIKASVRKRILTLLVIPLLIFSFLFIISLQNSLTRSL